MAAFGCLGVFVAGPTIAYERTEPLTAMISALSLFLGGVYSPLSVFPGWLERVAYFFPLTPALEGLRIALLRGGSWSESRRNPHSVLIGAVRRRLKRFVR